MAELTVAETSHEIDGELNDTTGLVLVAPQRNKAGRAPAKKSSATIEYGIHGKDADERRAWEAVLASACKQAKRDARDVKKGAQPRELRQSVVDANQCGAQLRDAPTQLEESQSNQPR